MALLRREMSGGRLLLVIAAPIEVRAVLDGLGASPDPLPALWQSRALEATTALGFVGVDVLHAGVSKANAAAAVARALRAGDGPSDHGAIVNIGIGGALPRADGTGFTLSVGQVIVASRVEFGDEGILTDAGFQDVAAMGFPLDAPGACGFACDAGLVERLAPAGHLVGPIATVSTCSGTDALAREVAKRTGALAESMEGAAVGLVAARLGVPFVEVRAISNYTGARAAQQWDLQGALAALRAFIGRVTRG
jgi:futalosine hydrolase